jgi:hypothetical protein
MGAKENNNPKITVNKLGEFLTATPRRQRKILEAIKYPSENKFMFTGYNEARRAIKEYVLNDFDENILLNCINEFEEKPEEERDNFTDSTINALTIILESNEITDTGFTFLPYDGENPKLLIEGVEVSVNPDFIVHSATARGEYIGAAKFHLSKSGHYGEEGGKYISAILYAFAEEHINLNGRTLRNTNCVSYDVFTDTLIECPNSIVRRWQDIQAGCQNIVAIWDSI